jgi:hypothetical protein
MRHEFDALIRLRFEVLDDLRRAESDFFGDNNWYQQYRQESTERLEGYWRTVRDGALFSRFCQEGS